MQAPKEWATYTGAGGKRFYWNHKLRLLSHTRPDEPLIGESLDDGRVLIVTRKERFFVYDPASQSSLPYGRENTPRIPVERAICLLARSREPQPQPQPQPQPEPVDSRVSAVETHVPVAESNSKVRRDAGTDIGAGTGPVEASSGALQVDAGEVVKAVETQLDAPLPDIEDISDENDVEGFMAMLDEVGPNPYSAWDALRDSLVEHPGYSLVGSNLTRKTLFEKWVANKKTAPRSAAGDLEQFVGLIHEKYKPSLFYTEFKRKYRKEAAFNIRLPDKEKEKLYREYATLMKKTPEQRKTVLESMLCHYGSDLARLKQDFRYLVFPRDELSLEA